jgi:hypothetical protein
MSYIKNGLKRLFCFAGKQEVQESRVSNLFGVVPLPAGTSGERADNGLSTRFRASVRAGSRFSQSSLINGGFNRFKGFLGGTDINSDEGFGRKIVLQIGATVVYGNRPGEKTIGDFLRPVVGAAAVFDGQGIFVRGQPVPFVFDKLNRPSKEINVQGVFLLNIFQKSQPFPVPRQIPGVAHHP